MPGIEDIEIRIKDLESEAGTGYETDFFIVDRESQTLKIKPNIMLAAFRLATSELKGLMSPEDKQKVHAHANAAALALITELLITAWNNAVSTLPNKADLENGKVPAAQLPSYVDDVIEVADYAHLPEVGETGKLYTTLYENKIYRWSGSAYAEVSASIVLGETSSTAYRGDRGKAAYDAMHTHANMSLLNTLLTMKKTIVTVTETVPDFIGQIGEDSENRFYIGKSKTGTMWEALLTTNDLPIVSSEQDGLMTSILYNILSFISKDEDGNVILNIPTDGQDSKKIIFTGTNDAQVVEINEAEGIKVLAGMIQVSDETKSWKFGISGDDFVLYKYENSAWTQFLTFAGAKAVLNNVSINEVGDTVIQLNANGQDATALRVLDSGGNELFILNESDGAEFLCTVVGITKAMVGLGNVDDTSDANKPISNAAATALATKADLVDGKVPATQLPSYVDDVIEAADTAHFPTTGETGKIYVALDTNKTYRWSGSTYVEISASITLGETSATAYRGDRGKAAHEHAEIITGNPHGTTKADLGLGNVDNTADANKPVSTAQAEAIALAPYVMRTQNIQGQSLLANTTYYFGGMSYNLATTGSTRRLPIAKSGKINIVCGYFYASNAGSAQTSALYIVVNNLNSYMISNAIVFNAMINSFNVTGLNIPVFAGDYVEFKLVTGAFTTAPSGVWSEIFLGIN